MTKQDLENRLAELEKTLADAVNGHNALVSEKEKMASESLYNLNTLFGQKREVAEWLNKINSEEDIKNKETI